MLPEPIEESWHLQLDYKLKDLCRNSLVRFLPSTVRTLFPVDDGRSDTVLADVPENCTNRQSD